MCHGAKPGMTKGRIALGPCSRAADPFREDGPRAQKPDNLLKWVGHFGLSQMNSGRVIDDRPDHAGYVGLVNSKHRRLT